MITILYHSANDLLDYKNYTYKIIFVSFRFFPLHVNLLRCPKIAIFSQFLSLSIF